MSVKQVRLPDLGEGLTEATIVRWLVGVGDVIAEDQIVAEVETAKATVELPAPHAGTVADLHAGEGEEIEVGALVLSVDTAAGDAAATNGGVTSATTGHAVGDDAGGAFDDAGDAGDADGDGGDADAAASDSDDADDGASGNVLVGYGTGGGRARRRRARAPHTSTPARSSRPRAKPPVRKLAKDLGVDLDAVDGSGPDGRITRDDVHAAATTAPEPSATAPAATARDGARREAVTGVRGRIADHLSVAWREIPAASCWVECDATQLLALRRELAAAHPDTRLTPLAIILRCCAVALVEVPQLNASFDAEAREIVYHDRIDLGVATQTDRGLLVPVVRDAAGMSVLELADAVEQVASGARANQLPPADLVGSTFTISNFGAFGIDGGGPIINHPEAGILGVGRITPRPWVVDDTVVSRPVVQLSLSFDHRVCDGAEAAGFLRLLGDLVERPTLLLAH
ncbi:MAG: 2-oxo acid dehydrogenase subunit E2 [Actinobacteria bacterium]|nr:2-oxo acid dehydrogenase subunit E2 [Actinomycetota bacterium]